MTIFYHYKVGREYNPEKEVFLKKTVLWKKN
jgi:hypothetical protein